MIFGGTRRTIETALVWLGIAGLLLPALQGADRVRFLQQHCASCHDAETRSGGLNVAGLEPNWSEPTTFAQWAAVYDRVARNEMPPRDQQQPPAELKREFLTELDQQLFQADRARQTQQGRVRLRRMTRQEFQNTLRDLLALPRLDIVGLLPADGRVAGYDKIAGGLDLSPAHLGAYEEAVERALDLAIAVRSTPPPVFTKRIYPAGLFKFQGNLQQGQFVLLKDKQPDPAYPPRGGFEEVRGYVAAKDADADMPDRKRLYQEHQIAQSRSAVGLLNPNLAGYEAAMNVAPIYAGTYRLKLSLWGLRWNAGKVEPGVAQAAVLRAHAEGKQQEGGRLLGLFTAPSLQSNEQELTTWLDAHESIVFDPVSLYWMGLRVGQIGGRSAKYVGPGVALDWFEIEGPLNATWPPESHRRLFGNLPIARLADDADVIAPEREKIRGIGGYLPSYNADLSAAERSPPLETVQSAQPVDDATRLLAAFVPRAFRRDIAPAELEPYLALLRKRLAAKDCFEDAMRRVYVAVLTSPEFLFHAGDARDPSGLFSDNNAFAVASRLSYWLWNGPPDERLLAAARDRSLLRAEVLRDQVDRLLADPRSDRFIDDFTNQWLELNRLDETTPDPQLYPEYRFLLHEGMTAETRAFVRELIARDLPITALVRPDFAMVTQRLAEHYGLQGVSGVEVRKLPLPRESVRGGLLGQAAIHKVTANGTTTSPVKRGVWVMDRLLNDPAPPPPPGVAAVDPDTRGATTIRDQLDRHRADAGCAACHAKIDPAGFALESFDPIGGFRERYRSSGKGIEPPEKSHAVWKLNYRLGPSVDPHGELPDGRQFRNVGELNALLLADPERLARAFVAHLSRYATGAELSYSDRAEIQRIVATTANDNFGVRALIHALADSRLFHRTGGPE
jgi:hypothetical protein